MSNLTQEMLDHYEITKLLGTYCHGIDRLDEARAISVYAEDSWDQHGPHSNSGPDFIRGAMQRMRGGASTADSHMLGQTLIDIAGDRAGAETYFVFVGRKTRDDGSEVLLQLGGRYVDKLVRESGAWKIQRRTCVRDWSVITPVLEDWLDEAAWVNGERSNQDPSYDALGIEHSERPANKPSA